MKMTNQEYNKYVESKAKPSPLWKDLCWAFCVGGGICALGQGLSWDQAEAVRYRAFLLDEEQRPYLCETAKAR